MPLEMGDPLMGSPGSKSPFAELLGLTPSFDVSTEGVDLGLGLLDVVLQTTVAFDLGHVGPLFEPLSSLFKEVVLGVVAREKSAEPGGEGLKRGVAIVDGDKVDVGNGWEVKGHWCHYSLPLFRRPGA